MTLETKYSVGDNVYLIYGTEIRKHEIKKVEFIIDEHSIEMKYHVDEYGHYLEKDLYWTKEEAMIQIMKNNGLDIGFLNV